jgi:isopenicillin N synthase-like dioxygenase
MAPPIATEAASTSAAAVPTKAGVQMHSASSPISLIDISTFDPVNNPEGSTAIAKAVLASCTDTGWFSGRVRSETTEVDNFRHPTGFLVIKGHGVPKEITEGMFKLSKQWVDERDEAGTG